VPVPSRLPPSLLYLIPFTRGRGYLQLKRHDLAEPQLNLALSAAGDDRKACARVRNLLGAILYGNEQPIAALEHHMACVRSAAIVDIAPKDPAATNVERRQHRSLASMGILRR
jgi:hypothetical protein